MQVPRLQEMALTLTLTLTQVLLSYATNPLWRLGLVADVGGALVTRPNPHPDPIPSPKPNPDPNRRALHARRALDGAALADPARERPSPQNPTLTVTLP